MPCCVITCARDPGLGDPPTRCHSGFSLMILLLTSLGFVVNVAKCDPPATVQIFLGVGMDSDTLGLGDVTQFFTEDRLQRLRTLTLGIEHSSGPVRVASIMSLLGVWMFVAQVLRGVATYLRSGFACIAGKDRRSFTRITRAFRLDLAFLRQLISGCAPRASVLRLPLTSGFAAWDACTSWGMGGYLDGAHFSISWTDLMAGRFGHVMPFFPFMSLETSHINYLELFAAFWFLRLWGPRLRGHCIVCMSDNTATVGMLRSLWGTSTFIPLLKQILRLLVRYDLALDVHWIDTVGNLIADTLSRGAMAEFYAASARYRSGVGAPTADREDWQLAPDIFAMLDFAFGPFMVDACTDAFRRNSHCAVSWTAAEDCMAQRWHGLTVFCNGPFSMLLPILQHFLLCKREEPVGTAALFILPLWTGEPFLDLVYARTDVFRVVRRFPVGTALFTTPVPTHLGGGRRYAGPTRWPVIAVWAGPAAP